ncbi:SusC/RagA family TonB-linked outer membrane protein [Chitinophaga skermanii]|nr:TonB-dependent receptor [Chitinophaga skermanii]
MRITFIQLILATVFTLSLYANKAHSQSVLDKSISISADRMEVRKVLSQLREQTGVKFMYSSDVVDVNKKISCRLESSKLISFFEEVLAPIGIDFKVIDNEQILLYQSATKPATPAKVVAVNNTITGKIVSDQGEALPGVSIRVKGTNIGTTTDAMGNFSLNVPNKESILQISYIGFASQEVLVGEQTNFNIKLVTDNGKLDEVVVVGYGTQRKKDITGSVAIVKADAIDSRPIVSAAAGLQGQAAGVNVSSPSGKPGAGLTVSIRGTTSLNAKNDPLFVVDGVIVENIDFLNPTDIESFTVLKDAASAAIYGASAANGVVLVTTKKGKAGASKVNVNAYTGFSNFAKKIDVLNAKQYRDLMKEMGGGIKVDADTTINSDWQDIAFGTGREHNVQVGISGGTEKGHYYISGGYQKQQGVVAPADYNRYSIRINLDQKVKEWLTVTANMGYTRSEYVDVPDNQGVARGGTILSALTSPPTIGIYKADGTYTNNINSASMQNPIAYAFGPDQKARDNRFIGNAAADFFLAKGLTFRSNMGVESQGYRYDYFLDPIMTDNGRAQKGIGRSESTERFVWLFENTLTYKKTIGQHDFTGLVGHMMQSSSYNNTYDEGRGFPNGGVPTLNNASVRVAQRTTMAEWSKRSYLARLNYSYADKYLLTANVRVDGSSRFPTDNKYAWFPSVSAAWRISKEDFFDVKAISDLKLRVGYGKTGNDGIGDYRSYTYYAPDGNLGYTLANIGNPGLKWESTAQKNIGIDLSILNNRVNFTIDGYIKTTTDLLVEAQIPPSSGFNTRIFNLGTLENRGIEFAVNAVVIDKAVRWNVNANISRNKNEVTELGAYTKYLSYANIYERDNAIRVEKGRSLGSFYGYVAQGVDPKTGDMIFKDLNGDKVIDERDRTYIGNAQPDFIYGISNNVRYKNFTLDVFIQGVQGNDLYNATRMDLEGLYDSKNQSTAVLRRWTKENPITDIPRAGTDAIGNSRVSSRFVEDGSYVRLKAVTLSYTVPSKVMSKIGFSGLNVYATGQNLLTITNYKGLDPEVSTSNLNGPAGGIDFGTYPQARAFIFGVKAEF